MLVISSRDFGLYQRTGLDNEAYMITQSGRNKAYKLTFVRILCL